MIRDTLIFRRYVFAHRGSIICRTSIARTPMARLPWLIRTRFESLRNSSDSSRKQIFKDFFSYFIMKLYVVSSH